MQFDGFDRPDPITAFNKGDASKISKHAINLGPVLAPRNNTPVGAAASPKKYPRLSKIEEDHFLLLEATARLREE